MRREKYSSSQLFLSFRHTNLKKVSKRRFDQNEKKSVYILIYFLSYFKIRQHTDIQTLV